MPYIFQVSINLITNFEGIYFFRIYLKTSIESRTAGINFFILFLAVISMRN